MDWQDYSMTTERAFQSDSREEEQDFVPHRRPSTASHSSYNGARRRSSQWSVLSLAVCAAAAYSSDSLMVGVSAEPLATPTPTPTATPQPKPTAVTKKKTSDCGTGHPILSEWSECEEKCRQAMVHSYWNDRAKEKKAGTFDADSKVTFVKKKNSEEEKKKRVADLVSEWVDDMEGIQDFTSSSASEKENGKINKNGVMAGIQLCKQPTTYLDDLEKCMRKEKCGTSGRDKVDQMRLACDSIFVKHGQDADKLMGLVKKRKTVADFDAENHAVQTCSWMKSVFIGMFVLFSI